MRLALFGDVHGNLPALEALAADLRSAAPDLLVCLGDMVDGYGHPREVVELIRSLRPAAVVLGNAEWRIREWPASIATMRPNAEVLFRWLIEEIGEENRAYLAGLPTLAVVPEQVSPEHAVLAFHGLPEDPFAGIRPPREEWPTSWVEPRLDFIARDEALVPGALAPIAANPHAPSWLVCGHTHFRMTRRWTSRSGRTLTIVNPGPLCFGHHFVGGRLDALYALLDADPVHGWRITFRDLDYDKHAAAASIGRLPHVTPFMSNVAARLRTEAR